MVILLPAIVLAIFLSIEVPDIRIVDSFISTHILVLNIETSKLNGEDYIYLETSKNFCASKYFPY